MDLYDNIIRDFSGLNNMEQLEYLNLGDNNERNITKITNYEEIATLSNSNYLDFSRNNTEGIINYIENLTKLEYLNLQENKIIFENIKKLHIYNLKNINNKSNEIEYLKEQSKAQNIELGYEYIYDTVEPHIDENGIKYITYEDLGARCDGIYDDMIAIRQAHRIANSKGYEVRETEGKTYHNIYIENLTVDTENKRENKFYIIIAKYSNTNFSKAKDNYWSENIYINGYKIINNDNENPYISPLATNSDKIRTNYIVTEYNKYGKMK